MIMKKSYLKLALTMGLMMAMVALVTAQSITYPWPAHEREVVIEPGAPGTFESTILGDTTASGERVNPKTMYLLKRGATYIYRARVENTGYELWVGAEDGDGPRPILQAAAPEGGGESPRPFQVAGDFYIKDLHITCLDVLGNTTDNATLRIEADGTRAVMVNCIVEKNRLSVVRLNANGTSFYGFNNIICDVGNPTFMQNCRTYTTRANDHDSLIIVNSTHYNMTNNAIGLRGGRRTRYVHVENSTFVGMAQGGATFAQTDKVVMKNNLWLNSFIFGDAFAGTGYSPEAQPYAISADSVFFIPEGSEVPEFVPSEFTIMNNNFHTEQRLIDALPDSSTAVSDGLWFDPELQNFGTFTDNIDEMVMFTNGPAEIPTSFITDYYTVGEAGLPRFMPDIDQDLNGDGITGPLDADFSYADTYASYSAATDGGPLGDRRWFPDWEPSSIETASGLTFQVFPNPVRDFMRVKLSGGQSVDQIEITNLLGQRVKLVSSISGTDIYLNTSELATGLYFVNFMKNGTPLGTTKILKR